MIKQIVACTCALAFCSTAIAESIPLKGAHDARMKTVTYNQDDVTKVVGYYGYSTDIELAPGESVVDIAIGDSLAWEIAPSSNHLFVKPREENAVTNMTVVTNKRVYQFALDARRSTSANDRQMYFQVRFNYPGDKAALAKAQQDQRIAEARARMVDSAFAKANLPINWNYYVRGERQIRPVEIYDDGRFTFMRFPGAQEIPAVFMINADGSESIVNGAMQGDQYVVQVVAKQLVLRKGQSVACLENRSFNRYGIATPSGTASPEVERVLQPVTKRSNVSATAAPVIDSPLPTQVNPRPIQLQGIRAESPADAAQGGDHVSDK